MKFCHLILRKIFKFATRLLDLQAKMHQIQFGLQLHPRPNWGAYSTPPDPVAGFKEPTSNGR